jgi:succinate dehydrogenase flavin-adding protein (antitoxin of CptAB toxin-antitoxin module)
MINARVIEKLSDEELDEFSGMLDKNASDEDLRKYVAEKIPNGVDFLAETMFDFKRVYLGMK